MEKSQFITLEQTADFLRRHERFLILTHAFPDGDTLGSGFALAMLLTRMEKESRVICADEMPSKYSYFMSIPVQMPKTAEYDAVVAVDVADAKLLGGLEAEFADGVDLCIDHHHSNTGYAKKTYLDSAAAANCECIYDLAGVLGIPVDRDLALALYTGVSTDTGCFRFSNTTAKTLRIGAALMETGIDTAEINRIMFETKSRIRVQLEGMALDNMEFHCNDQCAMITVTREMYEKTGCLDSDLEGITAISRTIEGVIVGVTLREKQEGGFKISVRTYPPIDASEICRRMGGGGHIRAAGCQLSADYTAEQARAEILKHVTAVLEENRAGIVTDR